MVHSMWGVARGCYGLHRTCHPRGTITRSVDVYKSVPLSNYIRKLDLISIRTVCVLENLQVS